ncbi:MAG: serine hydrolase domain-containing protein [Pseudomonadota bacterium]
MIKKIVLGVLATIVLVTLLLVGYILSIKVDRPFANAEPISTLHNEKYQDNALKAEQWLKSVYEKNLFPSFSVSIGIQGELAWEGVIGFSDLSSRTLADPNIQYRIGSVSKSMTATAVMRIQEKQVLAIDSNFNTYVSDYPAENSRFTIKQLLTHQGGVRHYVDELSENFSNREYLSARQAASIVENDALFFLPERAFTIVLMGIRWYRLRWNPLTRCLLEKLCTTNYLLQLE